MRISSCCPEWNAETTADSSGHFEFSSLTPGNFTLQAPGRTRTVRLEACDSIVTVNLCPVTARPTTPSTPSTVTPTPTETPTPGPGGTQPPSTGEITLHIEADRTRVQAGDTIRFSLDLRNGEDEAIENVLIRTIFTDALSLQGATALIGTAEVRGQYVSLQTSQLRGGGEVSMQVDAIVRPLVQVGAAFTVQATAYATDRDLVYSNILLLEVVGSGVQYTPPPGGTPGRTPTPVGGPGEVPATAGPTPGSGSTGELPYTGTGLPMAGIMLGGIVLLVRQLRLRRGDRRQG